MSFDESVTQQRSEKRGSKKKINIIPTSNLVHTKLKFVSRNGTYVRSYVKPILNYVVNCNSGFKYQVP